jgi:hypothetical protein
MFDEFYWNIEFYSMQLSFHISVNRGKYNLLSSSWLYAHACLSLDFSIWREDISTEERDFNKEQWASTQKRNTSKYLSY